MDGQASRGTAQPSAADGLLGSDEVRLAWLVALVLTATLRNQAGRHF